MRLAVAVCFLVTLSGARDGKALEIVMNFGGNLNEGKAGTPNNGDSRTPKYEGWSVLHGYSLSVNRFCTGPTKPVCSDPDFAGLGFEKDQDGASVGLFQRALSGKGSGSGVKLSVLANIGNESRPVAEWEFLTEDRLVEFSQGAGASLDSRPLERGFLQSFGRVKYTWRGYDEIGETGMVSFEWDFGTNQEPTVTSSGDTSGFALLTSVPEPTTAFLLGIGLAGLAAQGRRRH